MSSRSFSTPWSVRKIRVQWFYFLRVKVLIKVFKKYIPGLQDDSDQVAWLPTSRVDEFGEVSKEVDFVPEGAVVDVTVSLADIGSSKASLFQQRKH